MSKTLRVVELFAGIGAQRMALTLEGMPHTVVAISEIDRHALASYEAIYGDCPNLGDITKVERLPPCDLVTYSFPCQDLSLAGKRKGMGEGTRSGLVWEVMRLLERERDRPEWLLMENVPQVLTSPLWPELVARLDGMGYRNKWAKLDSSKFGSAQKRVRAFMISRLGAEPPDIPTERINAPLLCLRDVMEPNRDEKFVKRIPLEHIRWREPKPDYHNPQFKGIQSTLIDATSSRMESRRILGEDSLSTTLTASCNIAVVKKDEEERVVPLVDAVDNLRMAPKGRKAVGTMKNGQLEYSVAPSDKSGVSTPVAEDVSESFYSRRMLYAGASQSPTIRTFHSLQDMVKVIGKPGSSTPCAEVDGVVYYPERVIYHPGSSSPTVCTDHGNNRIKVIADMDCSTQLDYQNRLYSPSFSCPSLIAKGGDHVVKVVAEDLTKAYVASAKVLHPSSSCPTIRSQVYGLQNQPKVSEGIDDDCLVVNILTPRECWRLMGFPEWAFLRASRVCSETQLYTQAGNSIVVEVLEEIFKSMFPLKPSKVQARIEEVCV